MKIQHIAFDKFERKPWKNGLGVTHDIYLAPPGADHESFDIRCALSPIVEANIFSSFPGIERVITPIVGQTLELAFADQTVRLDCEQSCRFDSGLTPDGTVPDGPVTVVNVMARRGVWQIKRCCVSQPAEQIVEDGDLLFVFSLQPASLCSGADRTVLDTHDAALARGGGRVSWDARVLMAHLSPVNSPEP